MTINLDPAITPTVSDRIAHLTGPVILHLGPDFTLAISEQQAADLIDALTTHMHDRTDRWEITPEGRAYLAAH